MRFFLTQRKDGTRTWETINVKRESGSGPGVTYQKKFRTDQELLLGEVYAFVERERFDGEPPPWDIIMALFPENKAWIEKFVQNLAKANLLASAGQPPDEDDEDDETE